MMGEKSEDQIAKNTTVTLRQRRHVGLPSSDCCKKKNGNGDRNDLDDREKESQLEVTETAEENQRSNKEGLTQHALNNNRRLSRPTAGLDIRYVVAKWCILRLLGFVYWIAFLGAYYQNLGLMGSNGLQPAKPYMDYLIQNNASNSAWEGFLEHPTLFWWIELTDSTMEMFFIIGLLLSSLVTFGQLNSWVVMFALWLIYFSIVTTANGTSFYSYGWESQILETGFLAIFLCQLPHISFCEGKSLISIHPMLYESQQRQDNRNFDKNADPSLIVLNLFRWLSFRISLGAGLIKMRGSSCWTQKTCLHYHFETQPIPSPVSFIFHFLPKDILSNAVDLDLFVQLYTSWFVLCMPPSVYLSFLYKKYHHWFPIQCSNTVSLLLLRLGGYIQAGFMVNIIISGNFAFLNHLTIIPALACLDDHCWPIWLRNYVYSSKTKTVCKFDSMNTKNNKKIYQKVKQSPPTSDKLITLKGKESLSDTNTSRGINLPPRFIIDVLLLLLIAKRSWPVISNLLQLNKQRQTMNQSYDNFRLVNTYGAFGSVGKARYEPIISISKDGFEWTELEFPCKPGMLSRRPCFCAPYHYRLDWNIWFLGFKPHQAYLKREWWIYKLLEKILHGAHYNNEDDSNAITSKSIDEDNPWLQLLDKASAKLLKDAYTNNSSTDTIKYAKVDMYHYQMAGPLSSILYQSLFMEKEHEVVWWKRRYEESLISPVGFDPQKNQLYHVRSIYKNDNIVA